jgi:hypothetical protein
MATSPFLPGSDLSAAFYFEVVRPLVGGQPHAAALLGWGSDVLGYDTERSTDHGWGPRLVVFLDGADALDELRESLDSRLPETFKGWPVRFGWDQTKVTHHVTVTTLSSWLLLYLGVDPTAGMCAQDWLLTPQQRFLGVVAGAVHADDTGALAQVRTTLSWYPDQVWRWLLACQWHRVAAEEALVARAAEVDDNLGSQVAAARLVRDMMRLALLMDCRYAPYQKWLGSAFARGRHHDNLPSHLADALNASDAGAREAALAWAYTALAGRHNETELTNPLDPGTGSYHDRPARVLMADRFTEACLATVDDSELRELPLIGSVDQLVDNADVLQDPGLYRQLAALYVQP